MKINLVRLLLIGSNLISIFLFSNTSLASPIPVHQTIRLTNNAGGNSSTSNQIIPIKLAPGFGVNISFFSLGEYIQHNWLDNPAFVTLDVNVGANGQEGEGAQVIHLKRIEKLELVGLPKTSTTLLTVVTKSKDDKLNTYLFEIVTSHKHGALFIDFSRPAMEADRGCNVSEIQAEIAIRDNQVLAERLRRGIKNAISQRYIHSNSPLIGKVEQFLELIDCGMYKHQAAQKIHVPLEVIEKLEQLGNYADNENNLVQPVETVEPNQGSNSTSNTTNILGK